jgi:cob(I)alamin adenosyltransferase
VSTTGRSGRELIADSAVATGRGDDGTTGLLYGGRVSKDDAAVEAYGTIDEAVAALGVVRAQLGGQPPDGLSALPSLLLRLQRGMFVAGAELAANPETLDRLRDGVTRVDEAMVIAVETELAEWEARMTLPREFVVPGETVSSAALEVARVTVRRVERRVVASQRSGHPVGAWLVPWCNRVADLLWVLARVAERAEGAASVPASAARDRS